MNKYLRYSAYGIALVMALASAYSIYSDLRNLVLGLLYMGLAVIFSIVVYKQK